MSDSGRTHRPDASLGRQQQQESDSAYLPQPATGPSPKARYARVEAQRAAAAAQIGRTLKAWRKASSSGDAKSAVDEKSGQAAEQGHEVSEPGEPAEKEADAVSDKVAEDLHGGDAKEAGAEQGGAKEKAPQIGAKLEGVGLKVFRAKTNTADKGVVLGVDSTGKVHGELPPFAPKEWTREQLEVSKGQLERSIQTRKKEQARLGEHVPTVSGSVRRKHCCAASSSAWEARNVSRRIRDRAWGCSPASAGRTAGRPGQ